MLGASDGGVYAQIFAKRYPDMVTGMSIMTTLTIDSDYIRDIQKDCNAYDDRHCNLCFFFSLKNRVVAALYSEDTSTKYAFLEFVTKIFFCVFTICISIFFLNSFGISIFFQLFLERFTR